jgi:hypothetical protein
MLLLIQQALYEHFIIFIVQRYRHCFTVNLHPGGPAKGFPFFEGYPLASRVSVQLPPYLGVSRKG